MAGIYIHGLEMPKDKVICLLVCPDGRVTEKTLSGFGEDYKAMPVPDHGDLIDRDALPWEKQGLLVADEDWALPCSIIENAPTIIPASKKGM